MDGLISSIQKFSVPELFARAAVTASLPTGAVAFVVKELSWAAGLGCWTLFFIVISGFFALVIWKNPEIVSRIFKPILDNIEDKNLRLAEERVVDLNDKATVAGLIDRTTGKQPFQSDSPLEEEKEAAAEVVKIGQEVINLGAEFGPWDFIQLSDAARKSGDLHISRGWAEQAKLKFEIDGDEFGIASAANNLGLIAESLWDWNEAMEFHQINLELFDHCFIVF